MPSSRPACEQTIVNYNFAVSGSQCALYWLVAWRFRIWLGIPPWMERWPTFTLCNDRLVDLVASRPLWCHLTVSSTCAHGVILRSSFYTKIGNVSQKDCLHVPNNNKIKTMSLVLIFQLYEGKSVLHRGALRGPTCKTTGPGRLMNRSLSRLNRPRMNHIALNRSGHETQGIYSQGDLVSSCATNSVGPGSGSIPCLELANCNDVLEIRTVQLYVYCRFPSGEKSIIVLYR